MNNYQQPGDFPSSYQPQGWMRPKCGSVYSPYVIICPNCKWSIDITHRKLKENAIIYCYNCNSYINYKTNNIITTLKKEVSGHHDKN